MPVSKLVHGATPTLAQISHWHTQCMMPCVVLFLPFYFYFFKSAAGEPASLIKKPRGSREASRLWAGGGSSGEKTLLW